MINKKSLTLVLVIAAIASSIVYLSSNKTPIDTPSLDLGKKIISKNYPQYVEIVNPAGFINTNKITIGEIIGKKVILVDFWTYSCINCQRTTPYLNAWYEKYKDRGLEIIGIHTPEFDFEKNITNVQKAVQKEGIKYPVVLDNDYSTWNAYGNRYWPRKYLIDLSGRIVYDHIGEGAYEETEAKIQELLKVKGDTVHPTDADLVESSKPISKETYIGSAKSTPSDKWSLIGDWDIKEEYAENKTAGAKILYKYQGKNVYLVASSTNGVKLKILLDGKLVDIQGGEDVSDGVVTVKEDRLYKLIQGQNWGEHKLEIIIDSPGLKAYTFTFG